MIRFFCFAVLLLPCGLVSGCGSGLGEVQASGNLINPDSTSRTFTINPLTQWKGFQPNGTRVNVSANDKAAFFDAQGNAITSQAFYNLVTQSAQPRAFAVHVAGSGGAVLILANRVDLLP